MYKHIFYLYSLNEVVVVVRFTNENSVIEFLFYLLRNCYAITMVSWIRRPVVNN